MTEMFGSKDDFSCPKFSTAESYIGILSTYRGRMHHSKLVRKGPDSTEKTRQIKDRFTKIDTRPSFVF
ncbi:unnamed protein product [Pocillopora meandrina]|uniref:Uncharacterized protein n=1 Tax=Pocillopora meandrina TaxID=46732 RepID=A0AAU9X7A4_9CNID|nr:unnamed protein product [Pocillopora meandrina]